jgi:alginate O-acetyltransferase complex protein AlgJ
MKQSHLTPLYLTCLIAGLLGNFSAHAQDAITGIVGKNQWLFYKPELTTATDSPATETSLGLIQKFNKVLAANGVELVVVMAPLKMRIYAEHLPDDIKLNDYMKGNYDRMQQLLRSNKVNSVDINSAFLTSTKRDSDAPFYFRLDTHWSPSGAMVAAEAIKAAMESTPSLKKALDSIPEEKYKITINKRKRPSKGRDLVPVVPPNSPAFEPELLGQVNIDRVAPAKEDLLGNRQSSGLALLGSSYSMDWTGFSDALRFVLQRDVVSMGVPADQGSWVGMETYLQDDSFQIKAPKVLIWEMPERDMRAPPDLKYRPARYISDNSEWLMRASAWIQNSCKPSKVTAKIANTGLAANPAALKGAGMVTGATNEGDFIEINFDNPVEKLDYLSLRSLVAGSKTVTLEASGPGVTTRKFTLTVAGDDIAHALKSPLPSNGRGFNKVRIFPGKTNGFSVENVQICRQPEDLLG